MGEIVGVWWFGEDFVDEGFGTPTWHGSIGLAGGVAEGRCTHAARFCAFLRLCAGVNPDSFSSLLLRVRLCLSSMSTPSPLSKLPTGIGVCAIGSGEPDVVGRLCEKGNAS